jgi:uncharacterized protein (UPF0248 family)
MEYIVNLLNKIKWDRRLKPKDFSLVYKDRTENNYKEIPYSRIKRLEGSFVVVDVLNEEIQIPVHRIKGVKKQGTVIWKR